MSNEISDIESMFQEKKEEITIHKIESEELEIKIEPFEKPEEKPEEKTKDEPEEFDKDQFDKKMMILKEFLNLARGGVSIESRVKPVLNPENWKTSSFLSRGEINMIWSFISLAGISPEECEPLIDASINYALLNLSKDGFGLEKAIDMGKALTEVSTSKSYSEKDVEKPTEGMKG